jgi:hypothetical protein
MQEQSQALAIRQTSQPVVQGIEMLPLEQIVARVQGIQRLMTVVMKPGEHYGTIPGCGDKPTLFKSGSEKLAMTFKLCPKNDVTVVDLPYGHREYRICCSILSLDGGFVGQGHGCASTMESKWRYRSENTGRPVPPEYWRSRDVLLLGGPEFSPRKQKGQNGQTTWMIFQRVEHDNPADYYNTCLKMGVKRAQVAAILTVTGASDIFAQDLEDYSEFDEREAPPETKSESPFEGKTPAEEKGKRKQAPPAPKEEPRQQPPPPPVQQQQSAPQQPPATAAPAGNGTPDWGRADSEKVYQELDRIQQEAKLTASQCDGWAMARHGKGFMELPLAMLKNICKAPAAWVQQVREAKSEVANG